MIISASCWSLLIALQVPAGASEHDSSLTAGSRTVIHRRLILALPADDARLALTLVPGVVLRSTDMGIGSGTEVSLRLGDAGRASVFIDGVPVRLQATGTQGLTLSMDAVDSIAVTTGLSGVEIEDARGGVIEYFTRTGGPRFEGHLLAHRDGPFGNGIRAGYNRFAASAGGPLGGRLSWFASGEVTGQQSAYRGLGAADQPVFVWGPTDTTVTDGFGNVVTVPQFVASDGLRRPLDWLTERRAMAKLLYTTGAGGRLTFTGLASDLQQRFFPGATVGDPALFSGARTSSRLVVLHWVQTLGSESRHPTLQATVSLAEDRESAGLLTASSENATRDPALGIAWSTLRFTGSDSIPDPLTDQIVRNIRSNAGLRTPLLNRTDLRNVQPYRINPYGLSTGWPTQGSDGTLAQFSERRIDVRGQVNWPLSAVHHIRAGLEFDRATQNSYASTLLTQVGMDAWIARPVRVGGFVANHITLHSLSVDVGVRVDHFAPGGSLPIFPGRIFSNPAWGQNTVSDDTAYANSLGRVYTRARSHLMVTPRVRAVYAPSPRRVVWLEAGQVARPPLSGELFARSNADFSFTNTFSPFGRDVDYQKPTIVELGVGQRIEENLSARVSGFFERRAGYGARIRSFDDPANPGSTVNVNALTALAATSISGLTAALDWVSADVLSGRLGYALMRAEDLTTQQVSAVAVLTAPASWSANGPLGAAVRDVSAAFLFRAASGLSYTPFNNQGTGILAPDQVPPGSARLPWIKSVDFRLGKEVHASSLRGVFYADFRNLFGFRNVRSVYAETGTRTNALFQQSLLSPELAALRNEAQTNGVLLGGNAIDLRPDCSTWTFTPSGTVNCVVLRRVERRFGDGDGVYDQGEQTAALNSYFEAFYGAWRLLGPGRTVRIGVELSF